MMHGHHVSTYWMNHDKLDESLCPLMPVDDDELVLCVESMACGCKVGKPILLMD